MHPGQGPGLSLRDLGEQGGVETVTLLESEIPLHAHAQRAAIDPGDLFAPSNNALATSVGAAMYQTSAAQLVNMADVSLAPSQVAISRTTTCSRISPSTSALPCRACFRRVLEDRHETYP
jgi:microcystin-dependent protein